MLIALVKHANGTCISHVTCKSTQFINNHKTVTSCNRPRELAKLHNLLIIKKSPPTQNGYLDLQLLQLIGIQAYLLKSNL